MSHLQYFDYPGFGARVRKDQSMSQAVRIGDVIEVAGQGGWHPLTEAYPSTVSEQIDQAFANVEHALQQAGGKGWEQVYKVRCYFLSIECAPDLIRNLRKYCPDHQPIFTGIGVASLAFSEMQIELEVCAHLGK